MNSWWIDDIVLGKMVTGLQYRGLTICFWEMGIIISQMGEKIIKITVLEKGDEVHNAISGKKYTFGVD